MHNSKWPPYAYELRVSYNVCTDDYNYILTSLEFQKNPSEGKVCYINKYDVNFYVVALDVDISQCSCPTRIKQQKKIEMLCLVSILAHR